MPSFDAVNEINLQEVDNTVNNTLKAIATRYDFRGSHTELTFDRKEKKLHLVAADKMKMEAVREMLCQAASKRGIDLKSLKFEEATPTSGGALKRDVKLLEGIDQDIAKKMVKLIKDSKIKVQAAIQGDKVRVTGKQIDDLQQVMALLKQADLGIPLQFNNMQR
jgi:uncharacterized protein YajQ (UPF0234 family)